MSHSRRGLALILVLPLLSAACFHRLIASPGSVIADGARPSVDHADRANARGLGNDLTSTFLPRFCYIVGQIRQNGRRPSWDASGFGGRPLVGNPQAGIHYPPVWVAWWTGRPGALGWLTVAHLIWGGVGVYVLGRSIGLGGPAAVVAGGCYQASPYLIAHTLEGHYPHVWSACWYPWAFWGLSLALRRRVAGYLVLPAVLALTFLTGHPQEWYYLVLALTVWTLAHGYRALREGAPREAVSGVVLWAGLLAVSLGLCAVDLVPELAVQPWLLKKSAIPLEHVSRYQLHTVNLIQLLNPVALGGPGDYHGPDNYWETVFSVGLGPLVLALLGALTYPAKGVVRPWAGLVIVAVVFAAGRKLGLYSLAYAVLPGMERFRVPSRSLFLATLGASILAGAGVQSLMSARFSADEWRALRTRLRIGLVAAGLVGVLFGAVVSPGLEKRASKTFSAALGRRVVGVPRGGGVLARNGILLAGVVGLIAVVSSGRGRRSGQVRVAWGFGAIGLVELGLHAQSLVVCAPVSAFLGSQVFAAGGVGAADDRERPVRIASVGTLYPDLGAVASGLEKTNVNDSFQIQHAADLYERLYPILEQTYARSGGERPMDAAVDHHQGTIAQAVLDLLSVRYVISDRKLPLKSVRTCDEGPGNRRGPTVARNESATPRAYVVPRAFVGLGTDGLKVSRRLSEHDPRAGVFLERDPLAPGVRQPYTPAEWVSRDPDCVTVRVETAAPGLLVVASTWMPGWSATVDSSPATVLRGNHWQQVVPIAGAGRHEITLRYQAPGQDVSRAITAGALILWGGPGLFLLARYALRLLWQRLLTILVITSSAAIRDGRSRRPGWVQTQP